MELEHAFTVPVGVDRAWEVLTDVETIAPCMPGAALDTVDGDTFTGSVKVKLGPIGLTYRGKAAFVEKDATAHRAVIDAQGRDARGNGTAKATVVATLTAEADASTRVVVATDLAITGKPAQFGRGVMVDVGNKLIGQFADCLAGKLIAPAADDHAAAAAEDDTAAAADAADVGAPAPPVGVASGAVAGAATAATVAPTETDAVPSPGLDPRATPAAGVTATPDAGAPLLGVPHEVGATTGAAGPASSADSAPSADGPVHRASTPASEVEPIDLMASAGPAVAKRLAPIGVALLAAVIAVVVLRRRR